MSERLKKGEVAAFLRSRPPSDADCIRIYVGPGGGRTPETSTPVMFFPHWEGGRLVIPDELFHTDFIQHYSGLWAENPCDVCRFLIGGQYTVRVYWDRDKGHLRVSLPPYPEAQLYVLWFDWKREMFEESEPEYPPMNWRPPDERPVDG